MSMAAKLVLMSLLLGFYACCVASAALQFLAWRHVRTDRGPTLRGVWKPDDYFDEVGLRQMRLARWLLIVGAVLFLSYIVMGRVFTSLAGEPNSRGQGTGYRGQPATAQAEAGAVAVA